MKMTDGKKLVEVTMKIWNGSGYGPDWANEFFETAGLEFDGEVDAFMVDDVDYCIEQMEDWKNCANDYIDDEDPDGNRYVDAVVLLEEDSAELTAYRIRHNGEWNPDDCRRLCELADMANEYDNADSDTVEDVVSAAADKLGVEIW